MAVFTHKHAPGELGPDDPTMDGRNAPLLYSPSKADGSSVGAPLESFGSSPESNEKTEKPLSGIQAYIWNSMYKLLVRSGFVRGGKSSIDERLARGEQVFLSHDPSHDKPYEASDYVREFDSFLINIHSLQRSEKISAADAQMKVNAFIARHRSLEYPGRGDRKEIARQEAAPTTKQWGYRMVTFSNGTVLAEILPVAQENILPVQERRDAA